MLQEDILTKLRAAAGAWIAFGLVLGLSLGHTALMPPGDQLPPFDDAAVRQGNFNSLANQLSTLWGVVQQLLQRDPSGRMTPWVNPPFDASDYSIEGAGNSWTVTAPTTAPLTYTLDRTTMVLNLYVIGSTIVASGTPTAQVRIRVPAGMRIAGPQNGFANRSFGNDGYMINNGVAYTTSMIAPSDGQYIYIQRRDGTNLADSNDFTLIGQITLEVAPS